VADKLQNSFYVMCSHELEDVLINLKSNSIASVKLMCLIWPQFELKEIDSQEASFSFNFAHIRCDSKEVVEIVCKCSDSRHTNGAGNDL
jgi:hypothetical protein